MNNRNVMMDDERERRTVECEQCGDHVVVFTRMYYIAEAIESNEILCTVCTFQNLARDYWEHQQKQKDDTLGK